MNVSSAVTFPLTRGQLQAAFSTSQARRQLSSLSCGLACMAAPKVLPDPPIDTQETSPLGPATPKASSKLRRFQSETANADNSEDGLTPPLAKLADGRPGPRRLRSVLGLVSCAVPRDQVADDDTDSALSEESSFAGGSGDGSVPAARGGTISLLAGKWMPFRRPSSGVRKLSLVSCVAQVMASVLCSSCRRSIPIGSDLVPCSTFPLSFSPLAPLLH